MALTQDEVDEFVACQKRVPGSLPSEKPREMDWRRHSESKLDWDAPVEVGARLIGTVYLLVNPSLTRAWTLKLLFQCNTS